MDDVTRRVEGWIEQSIEVKNNAKESKRIRDQNAKGMCAANFCEKDEAYAPATAYAFDGTPNN